MKGHGWEGWGRGGKGREGERRAGEGGGEKGWEGQVRGGEEGLDVEDKYTWMALLHRTDKDGKVAWLLHNKR